MQLPGVTQLTELLQEGQQELVELLASIREELRINNWLLAASRAKELNKGSGAREELAIALWEINNAEDLRNPTAINFD